MENLLQVLNEATLLILTTQLFRHLLPGKKYLPYENVILSMAVLSMLIVPILSVVNADLPGEFGERVALLETENEMFSQHLEKLEEQETGLFRNNMADSIEVRVQKEAEAAGGSVKGVRLRRMGRFLSAFPGRSTQKGRWLVRAFAALPGICTLTGVGWRWGRPGRAVKQGQGRTPAYRSSRSDRSGAPKPGRNSLSWRTGKL